jgi:hypothetical protein
MLKIALFKLTGFVTPEESELCLVNLKKAETIACSFVKNSTSKSDEKWLRNFIQLLQFGSMESKWLLNYTKDFCAIFTNYLYGADEEIIINSTS